MSEHYVFVYGTLKSGQRNFERYLGEQTGARSLGRAVTAEKIFLMQEFESKSSPGRRTPGVFPDGNGYVEGELFVVPAQVVADLDVLEGVGSKYDRAEIMLESGVKAFMYIERPGNRAPQETPQFLSYRMGTYSWSEFTPGG